MPSVPRFTIAAIAVLAAALAGCGAEAPDPPPAAGPQAPGAPALLKREAGPGEVVVDGEASPRSFGPFRLVGRYRVRFAQYAPEAPDRSFDGQTPFVAELRGVGGNRGWRVPLFSEAAARGRRTLELDGSYRVEVPFGDFPFVLRFTPLR